MADGELLFKTKLDESGVVSGLKNVKNTVKNAFGVSAKAVTAVIGALAAGTAAGTAFFGALTKSSLNAVGSIEQNIGGVETLFKESADSVIASAKNAYKTAGMSADNYMATVTSFAASLLQSLGGNTEEAAKVADMAIIDMSDNANKMGTSMDMIQNAYQGFAKQNYTMLDNLKLGYGGTKTEMKRLLKDAQKISGVKYDLSSLSDIYTAIHVIQQELDITGTTAKEAATTIEGSVNSAKAAWDNYLAGVGTVEEFADAFETAATVIVKNLGEIIPRLADTLPQIANEIGKQLPPLMKSLLPAMIKGGASLLSSFASVLPSILLTVAPEIIGMTLELLNQIAESVKDFDFAGMVSGIIDCITGFIESGNLKRLFESGSSIVKSLLQGMLDSLPIIATFITGLFQYAPELMLVGISLIGKFAEGIQNNLPALIPVAMQALVSFSAFLRENVGALMDAGLGLIMALADSLIANIPTLIATVPIIITNLAGIINDNAPKILACGINLIIKLAAGLIQAIPTLVANIPKIIQAVVAVFTAFNWVNLGSSIIKLISNGVKSLITSIPTLFTNIVNNTKSIVQNFGWGSLGRGIIMTIGNGIRALITSIPTLLGSIGQNAITAVKNIDWRGLGSNLVKGICVGISGSAGSVIDSIGGVGKNLLDSFKGFFGIHSPSTVMKEQGGYLVQGLLGGINNMPKEVSGVFANALAEATKFGSSLQRWVSGTIPGVITSITSIFSRLPGNVWTWFAKTLTNATTFGNNMKTKATDAGRNFVTNVTTQITQLPGKVQTWFTSTISKASTFVSDFKGKATDAGKGFTDKLKGAMSGLPGDMQSIGSNIVSGIWKGISSKWDWLTKETKKLANKLFKAAKDALGIHSPSKKFRWIGEMCVEGMDEPIREYNPYGTLKASLASGAGMLSSDLFGGFDDIGTVRNIYQTFNIYQQVKSPSEMMRAARLEAQYGMAGELV